MKKNDQFEQLNEKLQEHIPASGYTLTKDASDGGRDESAPRSESAKITAAAHAKPSSRKLFNEGHSSNTNPEPPRTLLKPLMPLKPLAPKPPQRALAPTKPLMPAKPKI